MFYYGLSEDGHAREGWAYSTDLIHWTKSCEVLLDIGPAGSIDPVHAHKPAVLAADGRLYHFYCAVRNEDVRIGDQAFSEKRGIGVAIGPDGTSGHDR